MKSATLLDSLPLALPRPLMTRKDLQPFEGSQGSRQSHHNLVHDSPQKYGEEEIADFMKSAPLLNFFPLVNDVGKSARRDQGK